MIFLEVVGKGKKLCYTFFVLCTVLIDISLNARFFAKSNKLPVFLWYFEVSGKGGKMGHVFYVVRVAHGECNIHSLDSFS